MRGHSEGDVVTEMDDENLCMGGGRVTRWTWREGREQSSVGVTRRAKEGEWDSRRDMGRGCG